MKVIISYPTQPRRMPYIFGRVFDMRTISGEAWAVSYYTPTIDGEWAESEAIGMPVQGSTVQLVEEVD